VVVMPVIVIMVVPVIVVVVVRVAVVVIMSVIVMVVMIVVIVAVCMIVPVFEYGLDTGSDCHVRQRLRVQLLAEQQHQCRSAEREQRD
jgi:hypothetical protein